MRRLLTSIATLAALLLATPFAQAAKLYIAWDSDTSSCMSHTIAFYQCLLAQTTFNQMVSGYPNGTPLTLAETKVLTTSCAGNDFTCVVNNAGFPIENEDQVMHYYGTGWIGGTNAPFTVNGKNIKGSWVQTGANCDAQTCSGSHEAYEAATDGISADCCNGQYKSTSCGQCDQSCSKFNGNNGDPPWGCTNLTCGGATYKVQLLSPYTNQFDASGCTLVTAGTACGVLHEDCGGSSPACCGGLTCEYWSYSGQPPYGTSCCKAIGATCSLDTDCCGGSNCQSGKCVCVPEGMWCINTDECCAGSTCDMTSHSCVPKPATSSSSSVASSSSSGTGTGGAAGTGGAGGAPGTGGAGGAGGEGAGGEPTGGSGAGHDPGSNAGCKCVVAGASTGSRGAVGALAVAVLAAVAGLRRRRPRDP